MAANNAQLKSLNFSAERVLFKIFKTASPDVISNCQEFCNFPDVSELILKRKTKFLNGLYVNNNFLCNVVDSKFHLVKK